MNGGGSNIKLHKYTTKINAAKKNTNAKSTKNQDKTANYEGISATRNVNKESQQSVKLMQRKLSAPLPVCENNYASNNQILSGNLHNMKLFESNNSSPS